LRQPDQQADFVVPLPSGQLVAPQDRCLVETGRCDLLAERVLRLLRNDRRSNRSRRRFSKHRRLTAFELPEQVRASAAGDQELLGFVDKAEGLVTNLPT
jgi:hypothetical protein